MPTVTSITVYPVKSMRGIALECAELTPKGLRHDRLWMVTAEGGRCLTQRELPRMALVQTRLRADGVELSRPGHGTLRLPFAATRGPRIETRVWGDRCVTEDQGEECAHWLRQALETDAPLRLVRMEPGYRRPQRRPERYGPETTIEFADGAPYLVACQPSLDRLNAELAARDLETVPMNRFRPSIVIDGLAPFAERGVDELAGDGWSLRLCYPCERCVIPTIDQQTGRKHPLGEPFRTLADVNSMPGKPRAPAFGENAVLASGAGRQIRLGDTCVARA